ncbi:MAG: 3-isopropylmalate dehydrogenase [Desulfobacterales bacterium]|jgi:3-isopropylmalate dehydrogenase
MTKEYHISVIPGDGTGPEVVAEGIKILQTLADKFGFKLNFTHYDLGGEHYKTTGEILPENILESIAESDAIYLGAIGHPDVKPGILEKGILLKLRFYFDQYINLRPVKLYEGVDTPLKDKGPSDIDFVVVRENTEGLYAGAGGCLKYGTADEVAIQESINTRKGVERCVRYAFEYCRKRNKRKKLTLCGKTNVLTFAFDLWERTFNEIAKEYPDIETDYAHVDAICMWMVKNPEWFDVIVTDNMFGDIITDLGAMIQGGMGIAAGANINPKGISMFEPIGGSAPKYTGKNIINPIAAVSAAQIMLETLGESMAASLVEESVIRVLRDDLKDVAAGKMGYSTQEVGDLVINYIKGNSK